jgi:phosphate-selective porin OprO/OprP
MKIRFGKRAIAGTTLGAVAFLQTASVQADDTTAEIRLLKHRMDAQDAEIRVLKARLKQFDKKSAKHDPQQKQPRAQVSKVAAPKETTSVAAVSPPPVFVSFANGLKVESLDHDYSFRIGGALMVDGGGSSQPETGKAGSAGIRRARLEVEGKVAKYWLYKLQYDFAAGNTATVGAIGGIRDAYIALKHPALSVPFADDPLMLQIGNSYEPMGLETVTSTNFIDFNERSMAIVAFAPLHHIGVAAGAHGDNWSAKGGVYTTSPSDKAMSPAAGIPVPLWVSSNAGWVATGGGQYYDIAGRITYAPIKEQDRLLHLGLSSRYQRPNDATADSDQRVLALGSNIKTEPGIIGENLLGTTDLSCGVVNGVAGKCTKDVLDYGAELAVVYGPISLQAEYMGAHYDRKQGSILAAQVAGVFAPGGTSLDFNGYYAYGTWYLTGESRAESYNVANLNGATFEQIKIKNPVSAGGPGAWEVGLRFDTLNLNNGPYQGSYYQNLLALAPTAATHAAVANAGVIGGRESNMTAGLNWYPEKGFRLMADWTRVVQLSAPWDRAYLNGAHPNIFIMRAQVNW